MLCENPYMTGLQPNPCGSCIPCRVQKLRLWTSRLTLESFNHGDSCFVTLTYNEEHCPKDYSLNPEHTRLFINRLRKSIYPRKFRYYYVGEYGEDLQRPHYHLILFGISILEHELLEKNWGMGFVSVGDVNETTIRYTLGYCMKKLSNKDDPRLAGRYPEFSRMSRRPGIGFNSIPVLQQILETEHGCDELALLGDVPSALKLGRKSLPLGRYLKGKIREAMGRKKTTPQEALKAFTDQLRELQEMENEKDKKYNSVKDVVLKESIQKRRNLITRFNIFNKKGDL